jgi:hypothetical protein
MKLAHEAEKGAIGLEGEMIDAPMIKQVSNLPFNGTIHSHKSYSGRKYRCHRKGSWFDYT